jgi:hypothetical protein
MLPVLLMSLVYSTSEAFKLVRYPIFRVRLQLEVGENGKETIIGITGGSGKNDAIEESLELIENIIGSDSDINEIAADYSDEGFERSVKV